MKANLGVSEDLHFYLRERFLTVAPQFGFLGPTQALPHGRATVLALFEFLTTLGSKGTPGPPHTRSYFAVRTSYFPVRELVLLWLQIPDIGEEA